MVPSLLDCMCFANWTTVDSTAMLLQFDHHMSLILFIGNMSQCNLTHQVTSDVIMCKQESIPVGCVPPAFVVLGDG